MRPARSKIPAELLQAFDILVAEENAARRKFIAAKKVFGFCANDFCMDKAVNGVRCIEHRNAVVGKEHEAINKGLCRSCKDRPINRERSNTRCSVCLDYNRDRMRKKKQS